MHEGSYCTYIMASRSRTLYIGVTGNLHQRVFQHKWKERDGFTARYNCDRLVWFENFQSVQKAIAREKELKGWKRAKKIVLMESMNAVPLTFVRSSICRSRTSINAHGTPTAAQIYEVTKQLR